MEYDDDDFGVVRKKAKRRETQSWHKEVQLAMEEEQREAPKVSSGFVILNEATPIGADHPVTEIVPPFYFDYADAVDAIERIAIDADVDLEDEASVKVPVKGTHLESDEYYIVELETFNG